MNTSALWKHGAYYLVATKTISIMKYIQKEVNHDN